MALFVFGAMLGATLFLLMLGVHPNAQAADLCQQYRSLLTREAQAVYGPDAPVPMFAAQMRQESSCRADVTAWDNGRGAWQFMDGTSAQAVKLFPEIGPAAPYDIRWAIRAGLRYDGWIYKRLKGRDTCNRWAAALKGFNAGPGYPMQAQAKSPQPEQWFGVTEFVTTRQNAENFEYSRTYPHKILFHHQPIYASWGIVTCPGGPK